MARTVDDIATALAVHLKAAAELWVAHVEASPPRDREANLFLHIAETAWLTAGGCYE